MSKSRISWNTTGMMDLRNGIIIVICWLIFCLSNIVLPFIRLGRDKENKSEGSRWSFTHMVSPDLKIYLCYTYTPPEENTIGRPGEVTDFHVCCSAEDSNSCIDISLVFSGDESICNGVWGDITTQAQ